MGLRSKQKLKGFPNPWDTGGSLLGAGKAAHWLAAGWTEAGAGRMLLSCSAGPSWHRAAAGVYSLRSECLAIPTTALDIFISTWSHVPERSQQQGILEYANSRVGNAEKH